MEHQLKLMSHLVKCLYLLQTFKHLKKQGNLDFCCLMFVKSAGL